MCIICLVFWKINYNVYLDINVELIVELEFIVELECIVELELIGICGRGVFVGISDIIGSKFISSFK